MTAYTAPDESKPRVKYYDVEGMPYRTLEGFPVAQSFRDGAWRPGRLLAEVVFNGVNISPQEMCAWLQREEGASGDPTEIPFEKLWRS